MRRYWWICRPHGRQARMSAPVAGLIAPQSRAGERRLAGAPRRFRLALEPPFGRRRAWPAGRLFPFRGRSAVSSGARIGPLFNGGRKARAVPARGGILSAVCPRPAAWSSLGPIASDKPYLSMVMTTRRPTPL